MTKKLQSFLIIALIGLLMYGAYRIARTHVAEDVYRARLIEQNEQLKQLRDQYVNLRKGYGDMRDNYNSAVKKTAVTELVVYEDSSVCVAFIASDGTEKTVPTPFKMGSEVFCDFIVTDGQTFFRRIYDEHTAPKDAMVIDVQKQAFSFGSDEEWKGQVAYAKLNEPGRWTVTLTQGGALAIAKKPEGTPTTILRQPPPVKDFPTIDKEYPDAPAEVQKRVEDIGADEVFRSLFGSAKS